MIENANDLTNQIRLMASAVGARLWRRNVGMGWIGNAKRFSKKETVNNFTFLPGDVLIRNARPFHNGEAGQFDTWGWKSVVVTPDMVGQRVAVHVEIEVKFGDDRESTEQKSWGTFCAQQGVRVGVARTLGDAEKIIGQGS